MNWIESLSPSLLIITGGIITWVIKSKIEELKAIEEKLREERRKIYKKILTPYIKVFSDLSTKGKLEASEIIKSYKYREVAFELILFGSDKVICAYNDFLSYANKYKNIRENNPKLMKLFGVFLLEIRKSLGNKNTKLNEVDILRAMIKDIDKFI